MKTNKPKMLHKALGKTLARRVFELTQQVDSEVPVFVVGKESSELKKELSDEKVEYAVQETPRGTGDAVVQAFKSLAAKVDDRDTLLILNGDSVLIRPSTVQSLIHLHEDGAAVMSFLTTELEQPKSYGRVIRDSTGVVEKIVEAKNASDEELAVQEINAGFYLVRASALRDFLDQIQEDSLSGEFYLTDVVGFLRNKNALVRAHCTSDASEVMGINTQAELCFSEEVLRMRVLQRHLDAGVRMMNLESIWIEDSVKIEQDVQLEPGVILRGQTQIAQGSVIRAHSIIEDSVIGAGTIVEAHSLVQGSSTESDCKIGPFARLRPGTRLGREVKIGNFVETKNSEFRDGAKASHLSYLGDTKVGESCNIGAGTITCNYDGIEKHQTELGPEVFIGSNSSLVAPVKLGKGAIVGAGSVITSDVPEDALAVERSEQVNKKGGAREFREKRKK